MGTNSGQYRGWASRISLRAANAALASAVALLLGIVTTQSAQAQTFTVLHNFTGSPDGAWPYASLVRDPAGNLYSTTDAGGAYGYGTVFKLSPSGKETVLYSFTGGADGANPLFSLFRDAAGNLYGTTELGGASGVGTVFELTKGGKESVLYSFTGGADGCYPTGGLLRDTAGNWYGTAEECGASKVGTLFKLSKNGTFTVLHAFDGEPDGAYPAFTTPLMDKAGNLYGVTEEGGLDNSGAVYELSKNGKEKVLYSFKGGTTDGCDVFGNPLMDKGGNIYGTANACGPSHVGIVWKVSKGKETILHSFAGGSSDGAEPIAGVIMDAKGNMYGTTYQGGSANLGTAYKLSKNGAVTLLHTFTGSDGDYLYSGLIQDATGSFYSTTLNGGSGDGCRNGCGTVWKITK